MEPKDLAICGEEDGPHPNYCLKCLNDMIDINNSLGYDDLTGFARSPTAKKIQATRMADYRSVLSRTAFVKTAVALQLKTLVKELSTVLASKKDYLDDIMEILEKEEMLNANYSALVLKLDDNKDVVEEKRKGEAIANKEKTKGEAIVNLNDKSDPSLELQKHQKKKQKKSNHQDVQISETVLLPN